MMNKLVLAAILAMISVSASANGVGWGFADFVVSYVPGPSQYDIYPPPVPFHDPSLALGAPVGLTAHEADNSSVVTLGDRGRLVLSFNEPVKDDPDNLGGYDFIVFSNAIWVGGNPYYRWQELAYVEISNDGVEWFLIPPSKPVSELVGATGDNTPEERDTGHSFSVVRNYAEYTPTLGLPVEVPRTPEEFYCIPDRQSVEGDDDLMRIDAISGGGDAFDISEAVKQLKPGTPLLDEFGNAVPAGISEFRYIRITDALLGDWQDGVWEISAEIDAVADVRPAETLGKAKQRQDGEFAVIKDAVVTAVFTDQYFTQKQEIYIQAKDRSSAMRLVRSLEPIHVDPETIHYVEPFPVLVGDEVAVTGHISTESGEKLITDPLVAVYSRDNEVKPVGMHIKAALDNPGRLVRTWGWVKENGPDYFIIENGTDSVKVWCEWLAQPYDSFVSVTGVVGPVEGERAIKVRTQEDIVIY